MTVNGNLKSMTLGPPKILSHVENTGVRALKKPGALLLFRRNGRVD